MRFLKIIVIKDEKTNKQGGMGKDAPTPYVSSPSNGYSNV